MIWYYKDKWDSVNQAAGYDEDEMRSIHIWL